MEAVKMEVCCYSLESALTASENGADRIELCDNAHEGGTTPSYGLMKTVIDAVNIPVSVMIRPRGSDFLYSAEEKKAMGYDIDVAKSLGADGVVLGCLRADGNLDTEAMSELLARARPMKVTLHRAFDVTKDPLKTLKEALDLEVDRVLTSGQSNSAPQGMELIKQLVQVAGSKLSIMPGAGINEQNLRIILEATGVEEFHVSAKGRRSSKMVFRTPHVYMGHPDAQEYSLEIADAQRINEFRSIADKFVKNLL